MQVKGVSRCVAVTLEEAETFAPEDRAAEQARRAALQAAHLAGELDEESGEPVKGIVPARAGADEESEGEGAAAEATAAR